MGAVLGVCAGGRGLPRKWQGQGRMRSWDVCGAWDVRIGPWAGGWGLLGGSWRLVAGGWWPERWWMVTDNCVAESAAYGVTPMMLPL